MESLRVGGNEECEDADPPLSFVFFRKWRRLCSWPMVLSDHLAAGSPRPGFCTDVKGAINEINVRGGTGAGPPLVYLAVHGYASGT